MANHAQNAETTPLPAALIAERRNGWHAFTHATVITCASVAAVLIVMLLVFRVF